MVLRRPLILLAALATFAPLARAAAPATPATASTPSAAVTDHGYSQDPASPFAVLNPADFAYHVQHFNTMRAQSVINVVPDAQAWNWMVANIPLFTCPDRSVEEMYYFRWWSFRKHLIRTPEGYAFTEFLLRKDPISSAVGHHVMEGRWLRDPQYIDDYARYWLHGGPGGMLHPKLHNYSEWLADALYQRYLVTQDFGYITSELPDLVRDYRQWEEDNGLPNGLFWQYDVRDAMEESISGSRYLKNIRPPLNSYMYGNARAIAAIARLAGREDIARTYRAKAAVLRDKVEQALWNPQAKFFEVREEIPANQRPAYEKLGKQHRSAAHIAAAHHTPPPPPLPPPQGPLYTTLSDVREEIGFIPWYFELPQPGHGYEAAWAQFTDPAGFHAPFGITTAERRSPQFRTHGIGGCEWDGAVWPFATSQTLTALANVLRDYAGAPVTKSDWFDAFLTYTRAQHDPDGNPYIGEYQDEKTGEWIKVSNPERSRYYNHSTYADLVISGVIGLRPRADSVLELSPLIPANTWDWFCLDGVAYHHRLLTIIWDRDGTHFHRGAGLTVLANGKPIAHGDELAPLTAVLK